MPGMNRLRAILGPLVTVILAATCGILLVALVLAIRLMLIFFTG
jgi:hypothetical protein